MRFGDKVRVARMRWCEHVQRRDSGHIRQRMLNIELTTKEIHGCNEEGGTKEDARGKGTDR